MKEVDYCGMKRLNGGVQPPSITSSKPAFTHYPDASDVATDFGTIPSFPQGSFNGRSIANT